MNPREGHAARLSLAHSLAPVSLCSGEQAACVTLSPSSLPPVLQAAAVLEEERRSGVPAKRPDSPGDRELRESLAKDKVWAPL
jgi:hypothetical protein